MAYEIGEIRLSQQIFYYLLRHHELKEEVETKLYLAYTQEEQVQNLVKSQAEEADCSVERYGNIIYLIPKEENVFLGFSKAKLKETLCKSTGTDKDFYLSQFVILTLLNIKILLWTYFNRADHRDSRMKSKRKVLMKLRNNSLCI